MNKNPGFHFSLLFLSIISLFYLLFSFHLFSFFLLTAPFCALDEYNWRQHLFLFFLSVIIPTRPRGLSPSPTPEAGPGWSLWLVWTRACGDATARPFLNNQSLSVRNVRSTQFFSMFTFSFFSLGAVCFSTAVLKAASFPVHLPGWFFQIPFTVFCNGPPMHKSSPANTSTVWFVLKCDFKVNRLVELLSSNNHFASVFSVEVRDRVL